VATLGLVVIARPVDVKPQSSSWQLASIGGLHSVAGVWVFGRVSSRRGAELG
jgi:hypothetical protein